MLLNFNLFSIICYVCSFFFLLVLILQLAIRLLNQHINKDRVKLLLLLLLLLNVCEMRNAYKHVVQKFVEKR
jgi:hypothetical protein